MRFEGDHVALVIAENEQIAKEALKLLRLSMKSCRTLILWKGYRTRCDVLHPGRDSNIFHRNRVRLGSVDEAFEQCDVIVEGSYQTPVQEHAYLQPEAGVALR